jgi:hypothetical protein
MTDNYIEDDFDSDETDGQEVEEAPRGLRRAANKSKKLEQELANARRELAFTKAGINPDDPRMKYFVKGYDGDFTADAVRQAAVEAGFLASNEPNQQAQANMASQERVMQASAGAIIPDNGQDAALAQLASAMEEGGLEAMLDVARQYGIPISNEQ